MNQQSRKIILKRIGVSLLVGMLIGIVISEVAYLFLRDINRPPGRIELVIPEGTADKVASGETPPTIPDEMDFVLGDTLVVINEDITDHELGPLWIPPGTSASLQLDQAEEYAFVCTFQPTKYFGVDVEEPLTFWTRLGGIVLTGLPLGALFSVYSLVATPIKETEEQS